MKNNKTVFKLFWLWQDDLYEAWLRQMSSEGWHLSGVHSLGVFFYFEKGEPMDYTYKLDFKTSLDNDLQHYLSLFEAAGWEYVGRDITWKYFRKKSCIDGADEIYSDNASKIEKYKQILWLMYICILVEIIGVLNCSVVFLRLYIGENNFSLSFLGLGAACLALVLLIFKGISQIRKRIQSLESPFIVKGEHI